MSVKDAPSSGASPKIVQYTGEELRSKLIWAFVSCFMLNESLSCLIEYPTYCAPVFIFACD